MPRVTILGIGNTAMGDDGFGAVVARVLAERGLGDDIVVLERVNAEMGLLRHFLDSERLFVVDALDAGAEPGSVFRFGADEGGVTSMRSNNIHGMGVGYLLTNARLSGANPEVIIYGVQVGDIRPRPDMLTPPVQRAVATVAEMLEHDVRVQQA